MSDLLARVEQIKARLREGRDPADVVMSYEVAAELPEADRQAYWETVLERFFAMELDGERRECT